MKNSLLLLFIMSTLSIWAGTKNEELTCKSPLTKNTCSFTNAIISSPDSISTAIALRDYQYYEGQYKKAHDRKIVGLALVGGSIITAAIGYRILIKNILVNNNLANTGVLIHFTGILMFNTGVPLFAWGETEQNRNKEAMEKCHRSKTSLQMVLTGNGVGLVFSF